MKVTCNILPLVVQVYTFARSKESLCPLFDSPQSRQVSGWHYSYLPWVGVPRGLVQWIVFRPVLGEGVVQWIVFRPVLGEGGYSRYLRKIGNMVCGVSCCNVWLKKMWRTGVQKMVPECVLLYAANSWPMKKEGKRNLFSFITYHSSIMTPRNDIPCNSVWFYPK
jgi:hypothetical protein